MTPPEQHAEFVAHMEDILDRCQRPDDPQRPLIGMDEPPVQLIQATRCPGPARPGKPERVDDEYERKGAAALCLFTAPLPGWRRVSVRAHRTAVDWAGEVRILLEEDFPDAENTILICDNVNTHTIGALYKAFPPAQARALAMRSAIHSTPKHGSWLNVAEIDLSVLTRQCLDDRIPDIDRLRQEVRAWYQQRNDEQKGVDWQFTTADARIRLKRLYPQIQT